MCKKRYINCTLIQFKCIILFTFINDAVHGFIGYVP